MDERFSRYGALIGEEGLAKLNKASVIVFGIGGVGGSAAKALLRAGVGHLTFVDNDTVALSNINRQEVAYLSTVGKSKVEVMKQMALDINPDCKVETIASFLNKDNVDTFHLEKYDYVIDAIDTVTSKLLLIKACKEKGVPIISAMGAGNKLHPELFEVADIYDTSVCPLAKAIRSGCRKEGIKDLKVVYSKEEPAKVNLGDDGKRKAVPGSSPFAPNVMGYILASEVCNDLLK